MEDERGTLEELRLALRQTRYAGANRMIPARELLGRRRRDRYLLNEMLCRFRRAAGDDDGGLLRGGNFSRSAKRQSSTNRGGANGKAATLSA